MRRGQTGRQVLHIGGEVGRNLRLGIAGADILDILLPALLSDLQAATEMFGQQAQRLRHHFAEHRRTLASTGHQQAENTVVAQQRIRLGPQRQHFLAHRIADQFHLVLRPRRQAIDLFVSGGDRVDLARHQPVDPAEHRILLVDRGRNAHLARRQQSRERRIAAEADHR